MVTQPSPPPNFLPYLLTSRYTLLCLFFKINSHIRDNYRVKYKKVRAKILE